MEVLIYFLIMILMDSFLYGFCYEIKMLGLNTHRGLYSLSIFDTIYENVKTPVGWLFDDILRYRIFQKTFEIVGLIFIGLRTEWDFVIIGSVLLAYYVSTFEMGYYVVMNQFKLPFTSNEHLQKWWNVGGLIKATGQRFNPILFYIYATMGLIVMLLFSFKYVSF